MRLFLSTIFVAILWVNVMGSAYAVPPPDFLFSVGAQLGQVFSAVAIFLSAIVVASWQFLKTLFHINKKRWWVWILIGIFVLLVSFAVAYFYQQREQTVAMEQWESEVSEKSGRFHQALSVDLDYSISNEDFSQVLTEEPFILDAREDEEYQIGHLDGSVHVRYADLIFGGEWQDLPFDQPVYVLCWSGIRGQEVAEFLRSKGVDAYFLEEGADGWVSWGGDWQGEIKFSKVYSAENHQRVIGEKELANEKEKGALIVDSREEQQFPESIHIATFYTASDELEEKLAAVPKASRIITVCDDWVSCFDAKVTGIKLEALGHTFLGRHTSSLE